MNIGSVFGLEPLTVDLSTRAVVLQSLYEDHEFPNRVWSKLIAQQKNWQVEQVLFDLSYMQVVIFSFWLDMSHLHLCLMLLLLLLLFGIGFLKSSTHFHTELCKFYCLMQMLN
eukprot:TRINITY_DN33066_c0_g1_i2.p1 TRINITY_DN33066_c0_g1~~TRINITY_DN33066_c0_g1_i2.p1  ORF type:complete len:113 (-),score=6.41 TRINITY_DN33066_c0_g1_i2:124-462(-)